MAAAGDPPGDHSEDHVVDLDEKGSVDQPFVFKEPTFEIVDVSKPPVVASPYDAEKARDDIRGKLALLLIRLLFFIVIATFVTLWIPVVIAWSKGASIDITTPLKDTVQLLLAPVVGLVGAATGYYFGVSSQKPTAPTK